jgi:hypothetical protein
MRARLQPLLQQAAASLLAPDPSGLWPISCPLGLTGGVPLLPISPAAFTRECVLVHAVLQCRCCCGELHMCVVLTVILVCRHRCPLLPGLFAGSVWSAGTRFAVPFANACRFVRIDSHPAASAAVVTPAGLQSLTNSLLVARVFGCRPVLGVLAAWQTCLLWSSLGSSDTAALHSLAVRGLEPAAREGPRHKTVRGLGGVGGGSVNC